MHCALEERDAVTVAYSMVELEMLHQLVSSGAAFYVSAELQKHAENLNPLL